MSRLLAIARNLLAVIGALTVTALGALFVWSACQHRKKRRLEDAWDQGDARTREGQ